MKALCILALLAFASPAIAQAPSDKQNAPAQEQNPLLYDKLLPQDSSPPAPTDRPQVTISAGHGKPFIYDSKRIPIPSKPQPKGDTKGQTGPSVG